MACVHVIIILYTCSLYDLHYSLLRQNLSLPVLDKERKVKLQPLKTIYEPWKEYAPSQPDPRVLYVIGTGSLSSPSPRVSHRYCTTCTCTCTRN